MKLRRESKGSKEFFRFFSIRNLALEAGRGTSATVSVLPRAPQGSLLSPLLIDELLYELGKELEWRSYALYRCADHCNVYVVSRRTGDRVKESIAHFLTEWSKLGVNRETSTIDLYWNKRKDPLQ